MADIKGIVVKIEGDANPLVQSLKQVEQQIKADDASLKSLEKALKLDPKNVDLLAAKEKVLADKTAAMTEKMQILQKVQKDALSDLPEEAQLSASQMAELDSAIASTSKQLEAMDDSSGGFGQGIRDAFGKIKDTVEDVKDSKFGEAIQTGANIAGGALDVMGTVAQKSFSVLKSEAGVAIDIIQSVGSAAVEAGKMMAEAFVAAGKAMAGATLDTAKVADEIDTLAEKTGLSAETIQEFNYAEKLWDVNTETITSAMMKNEKQMFKAINGNKEAAKTYKELGVAIVDANGNM